MTAAIFWLSGLLMIYTLVGYPLLINWVARFHARRDCELPPTTAELPRVCVIIAAYNEAQTLERKLDSLSSQNYPTDRLSILVVSDGSTDGTVALLERNAWRARSLVTVERRGKPHALNLAAANANAEILLFTDARQPLGPDAVSTLVRALGLPEVGVAGGALSQRASATNEAENVGLYWRYEAWIRKSEARVHSTAGASGALYAIRAGDFTPLPEDTLLDDFETPIRILRKGKRIVLCEGAQAFDEVHHGVARERERKIRTLAGNYQAFARNPWLFNPLANPIWVQFISHKVLRLLIPYFFVMALVSAWLLDGWVYDLAWIGMLAFLVMAALGFVSQRLRNHRALGFCYAFAALNLASVAGLARYLAGSADVRWKRA
ncbi:MAG: glycosyltransferase [Thiotrichales bacterium]